MRFKPLAALPSVALALLLSACGGSEEGARIVSFTADPAEVTAGSSSTLSWVTTGAETLRLQDGEGKAIAIGGSAKGSVSVRPVDTTAYRLTVTGDDGEAVEASVTVKVTAPAPRIEKFAASPQVIGKGGTSALWWIVTGADSIEIEDDEGARFTVGARVSRVEVSPERTTIYTLIATGNGVATAETVVEIGDGPEVTFTATPGEVIAGEAVSLGWTTRNATHIEVREGSRKIHGTNEPTGQVDQKPQQSTTYELVATGPAGVTTRTVDVKVRPFVEFSVSTPGPVRVGRQVEVAWRIGSATSASILGEGEILHTIARGDLIAGSASLPVGASGSFELVAKGEGTESRATASIELTEVPVIDSFEVDPVRVSAGPGAPADVEVRWAADGATSFELVADPGGPIPLDAGATAISVPVEATTTFQLVARNADGFATGEATVAVVPYPTIHEFLALPARAGVGQSVTLRWWALGGTSIEILRDGAPVHSSTAVDLSDPPQVSGDWTDVVLADATYELLVDNGIGGKASRTLTVTAGAPVIREFAASEPAVAPGASFDLEWANEGGTSLEIVDGEGASVCATADLARIAVGACNLVAGASLGDVVYTLRVRDPGDGVDERSVTVRITDGPIIRSFAVESAEVNAMAPVHLAWEVGSDASGAIPTLLITGSGANEVNPLDPPASLQGGADMVPLEAGAQRYTLTASTPGTQTATASVDVTVYGIPEVTLAASPPIVDDDQPATTLQWTSTHGVSISILDQSEDPPVLIFSSSDPDVVAAGSIEVEPDVTPGVTYYAVVTNPLGRTGFGLVTVAVDPAQALSLAVQPDQLLEGETTTLTWSTLRSTTATITFDGLPAIPAAKAFVDVSALPDAEQLTLTNATGHGKWAQIAFPAGFTFPFDGADRAAARVTTAGFVTFDLASTSVPVSPALLPAASSPSVHLAPFWADLDGGTGELWWAAIEEDGVDALVIQWKGISFFASAAQPSSLDFEVVLRADGTYDFRYGDMIAEGSPAWARGAQASIGNRGASLSFLAEVDGGLADRAFSFPAFPLASTGSWTILPAAGADVRLHASNAHSADHADAALEVWPAVRITAARLATAAPAPGQPFVIEWTTSNATAVWVEDEAGVERCAAAPAELDDGSCAITEGTFGDKVFVVHAEGGIGRNAAERAVDVPVYTPFSIDTFTAGPALVEIDDPVTVAWTTTNAATMTLTANGAPVDLTGRSMAGDSLVLQPQIPTVYALTVESSEGRSRTATRTVQVRTAFANSLSATATQLLPGQSTTISWGTAGTDQVNVTDGPLAAPTELGPGDGFIDLETRPTANPITITGATTNGSARIDLPEGFSFPYFGEYHDSLSFLINGHLSFDLGYVSANRANNPIPQPNRKEVHLAPFWGTLNSKPSGVAVSPARFYWEHIDTGTEDFVVLQWSHMMFNSSSYNPSDLNFQVVLFRDGTFDFRYGTMTGTTAHEGTICTIGYEDPTGTQGFQFSYNSAVPGGLANRGWRFVPHSPASGSMTVTPAESKTYRVCVTGAGGYVECRSERVVVLQPGDLAITELMLDPVGGAPERWFEIRNLSPDPLDLEGLIVGSAGGTPHQVGPLLLAAGGYATFAASAQAQGFAPDAIVGTDVALDTAGTLSLEMPYPASDDPDAPEPSPLVLANVTWDATWAPAQPGVSLYLDPTFHFRATVSNSDRTRWCEGDAAYDGINLGSPGAHGGSCKSQHYVVDWRSSLPFIDIEETGLLLNQLTAHDGVGQMPGGLGFTMPFFGGTVSDLYASASGFVSFDKLNQDYPTARALGTGGDPAGGLVAAQWENFELPARLNAKFLFERRTVGGRQVAILQWTRFQRRLRPDNYTFQIQLWSDGDIVVANKEMAALAGKGGASATIGIEAPLGTASITYSRNQALLDEGQVLLFHKK